METKKYAVTVFETEIGKGYDFERWSAEEIIKLFRMDSSHEEKERDVYETLDEAREAFKLESVTNYVYQDYADSEIVVLTEETYEDDEFVYGSELDIKAETFRFDMERIEDNLNYYDAYGYENLIDALKECDEITNIKCDVTYEYDSCPENDNVFLTIYGKIKERSQELFRVSGCAYAPIPWWAHDDHIPEEIRELAWLNACQPKYDHLREITNTILDDFELPAVGEWMDYERDIEYYKDEVTKKHGKEFSSINFDSDLPTRRELSQESGFEISLNKDLKRDYGWAGNWSNNDDQVFCYEKYHVDSAAKYLDVRLKGLDYDEDDCWDTIHSDDRGAWIYSCHTQYDGDIILLCPDGWN